MLPHLRRVHYLETYHPPRIGGFKGQRLSQATAANQDFGRFNPAIRYSVLLLKSLRHYVVPFILRGVDADAEHVPQLVDALLGK